MIARQLDFCWIICESSFGLVFFVFYNAAYMLQEQEAHAAEVCYLALDYILFLIFQERFH